MPVYGPAKPAPDGEASPAIPAKQPESPSEPSEGTGEPDLTPEEQLERYEKALKEDDWGHQPC